MRTSTVDDAVTIKVKDQTMLLNYGSREPIVFVRVPLTFESNRFQDVFGEKNNKTVAETLAHPRYASLAADVTATCSDSLDKPLGLFLMGLKASGDALYKRFLNKDGDRTYSTFSITTSELSNKKGVYAYVVDNQLKYIGRCKDSMKKRVNQGYGNISPKNCYIDGQRTNCRVNALVTQSQKDVSLWIHLMESDQTIECLEKELIGACKPDWNIQCG